MLEMEGTWEEILAHAAELAGRRVRLTVLDAAQNGAGEESTPAQQFAAAMLEAEELERGMDFSLPADSVALVREARSGAMYGYEPTE
jgi:hypothetical protein